MIICTMRPELADLDPNWLQGSLDVGSYSRTNLSLTMLDILCTTLIFFYLVITVLPAMSDSDVIFCLQLLSKTLTCTLDLTRIDRSLAY